ncbi:MAG TPA: gamma-glutamyl-gamma-aminobutyrate hydrolase family protein [Candidatus Limnocylindria bacterium]|nr:gamma-glutamyl-gamma-aminobutyrate hydrolase family protein [Candidatus Limnocylindria bacterium]
MAYAVIIDSTLPEDKDFNNDLTDALSELGVESILVPGREAHAKIELMKASRGIIVGGIPTHHPSESAEELQSFLEPWLLKIEVPILGICLGHQAIGLSFGASMRRNEEVEKGTITVEVMEDQQNDPIFTGLGKSFQVVSLHWASISIKDAPQLIRLARSLPDGDISTGCENQIIRVANRHIYGVQFHPEKSELGRLFLRNFLYPVSEPNLYDTK